ncbi:hypothetical protein OIU74_026145 [Salix koriyanagi]|uniref:Uncharacterized protein n=1 Tax=Salix koriyanagi TaxID=2511006 RepID=A0A9Q0W2U4_9ROSI|nr:hypothetical protein OIU74_026145 [Salix koriyanagi]
MLGWSAATALRVARPSSPRSCAQLSPYELNYGQAGLEARCNSVEQAISIYVRQEVLCVKDAASVARPIGMVDPQSTPISSGVRIGGRQSHASAREGRREAGEACKVAAKAAAKAMPVMREPGGGFGGRGCGRRIRQPGGEQQNSSARGAVPARRKIRQPRQCQGIRQPRGQPAVPA